LATLVKTDLGKWKAVIRKTGWPTTAKTFRTKRDAEDWARRTEDDMVRGAYIQRAPADRLTLAKALERYLAEVTPTKRPSTQISDRNRSKILIAYLGKYSLSALTPEIVAKFRDARLAGEDRKNAKGKPIPRSNNTVRLDLALLGHLFTVAIKEWGIGLPSNPVMNIRRPAPGPGRNRRLTPDEEKRLLAAVDQHSNPMLRWIVRIALETGMRSSEIVTLRRMQVDVKRRIVRLLETKNTSPRTVPLTSTAAALFHEALHHPVRPIDTDLIFFGEPGRDGKRSPYQFNPVWLNIKREQGLADVRFHDLRHEAVSRFVEAGFSDQEVSAISGHKSMQMLKRYTHLRTEDLVVRIDTLLESRKATKPH
jgi:integrase